MNDYPRTYVQAKDYLKEDVTWNLAWEMIGWSGSLITAGVLLLLATYYLKEGGTGYQERNRWYYRGAGTLMVVGCIGLGVSLYWLFTF